MNSLRFTSGMKKVDGQKNGREWHSGGVGAGLLAPFCLSASLALFLHLPLLCTTAHTPLPPVPLPVLPPSRHTPSSPEPHSTVRTAPMKARNKTRHAPTHLVSPSPYTARTFNNIELLSRPLPTLLHSTAPTGFSCPCTPPPHRSYNNMNYASKR
jgi:hypothetical protein